jgi:hypothetical protein
MAAWTNSLSQSDPSPHFSLGLFNIGVSGRGEQKVRPALAEIVLQKNTPQRSK